MFGGGEEVTMIDIRSLLVALSEHLRVGPDHLARVLSSMPFLRGPKLVPASILLPRKSRLPLKT